MQQQPAQVGKLRNKDPHGLIGRSIDGRYTVESVVGIGGMGVVYKGKQAAVDRVVAIKVLMPEMIEDESLIKRFQLEARAASRLHHPNSITIHDFGREGDLLYIVMEFLDGKSLQEVLRKEKSFSPERTARIISQACGSLHEAHTKGIIHRDIKPDNIFLRQMGAEKDFVKVLDFGVAKLRDPSINNTTMTQAGMIFGTPKYMSPEQAKAKKLDGRSDLYALGVVAYECLVGRVPFLADDPVSILIQHVHDPPPPFKDLRPDLDIPSRLEAIVMRAMAKDRKDRYPNADVMRDELDSFVIDVKTGRVSVAVSSIPTGLEETMAGPAPVSVGPAPTQPVGQPASSTPPPSTPPATPYYPHHDDPTLLSPAPREAARPPREPSPVGASIAAPPPRVDSTWSVDGTEFDILRKPPTQMVRYRRSNRGLLATVLLLGVLLTLGVLFMIYRVSQRGQLGAGDNAGLEAGRSEGVMPPDPGESRPVDRTEGVAAPETAAPETSTPGTSGQPADGTPLAEGPPGQTPPTAIEGGGAMAAADRLVRVEFQVVRPSDGVDFDFGDRTVRPDAEANNVYFFDPAEGEVVEFTASADGYRTRRDEFTLEGDQVEVRVRLRSASSDHEQDRNSGFEDPYGP